MQLYWQSKIFALLHDPVFKPFYTDKSKESLWRELDVMADWKELLKEGKLLTYLRNADYISAASDRGAISNIDVRVNAEEGLEISHLLSGAKQRLQVSNLDPSVGNDRELIAKEQKLFPEFIKRETNPQKVFWWLWRCLPTAACKASQDTSVLLMPADTRIPDTSLWSHTSMTAALAGASIGYQTTMAEFDAIPAKDLWYKYHSQPYLVSFSFAPVQDLIKSSRKMRDFWAGSWILHYLSATISWKLAKIYGADSLLYPSLFHQPLIDNWLLDKYPDFNEWIKLPATDALLTAGFPNVLVLVLPKDEVSKAMQTAKQVLKEAWRDLGNKVFDRVGWGQEFSSTANLWEWDDWLWDIRECFRGDKDPFDEFKNDGDYWQWNSNKSKPDRITARPLFTMGNKATISFGIVIAHQSVPLAIALENLWAAEAAAKEHKSEKCNCPEAKKDAVQVRIMYQNGNILSSTSKFKVFDRWRQLLEISEKLNLDSLLFEQAATVWEQHPAPNLTAIDPWCRAFCDRREALKDDEEISKIFCKSLVNFLTKLMQYTQPTELDIEVKNWLKLAAFTLRRRHIELGGEIK